VKFSAALPVLQTGRVMYLTVVRADIHQMGLISNAAEPVMNKHVEREQTNRLTELTKCEMQRVSGGLVSTGLDEQILAHYHPITSVETSPYRFPGKKKP
jgi:hypothetical protein